MRYPQHGPALIPFDVSQGGGYCSSSHPTVQIYAEARLLI